MYYRLQESHEGKQSKGGNFVFVRFATQSDMGGAKESTEQKLTWISADIAFQIEHTACEQSLRQKCT